MAIKIIKCFVENEHWKTNALAFMPDPAHEVKKSLSIMSHGYTSHKASILNWATRLCEEGIPTILFDQPGHYLGGFNEVESFNIYKVNAHKLFETAYTQIEMLFKEHYPLYEHFLDEELNIIIAGHSLSALLAIKALELSTFKQKKTRAICVGLGLNQSGKTHIFQTPFYKSTLNVREQLVSPALNPENVFPWIGKEKAELKSNGNTIHFITGEDDIVVGKDGTESIFELLSVDNNVSINKPKSLAHHTPELAASHIKKYLKSEGII